MIATTGLRIAIASCGLGHVRRGIEAWAADLYAALRARGADVVLCGGAGVALSAREPTLWCWPRGSARTARLLSWLPRRGAWRLGLASPYGVEQLTFALSLIAYLRRHRIDILHVQDPHVALHVQRAWRLGWLPTRTILAHGTDESLDFLRKIVHLQHLTPCHAADVARAGLTKPTWTTIPNFIDTEQFRPGPSAALRAELGIPPDARIILTAAAIKREHKRIDHLIAEVAQLRLAQPQLPVWLVIAGGQEDDTAELTAWGRQLLGERVRFLVSFPRDRMPELYRLADVFVLCSLREMMPVAILEALASGLPCLVHADPVLRWMVGPGGAVLDMSRPGELSAALAELLADAPRAHRLGERAREHCQEQFGRDRVVDQIEAYYRQVAEGCGG